MEYQSQSQDMGAQECNNIVSIFDASAIFWPFVKAIIEDNSNKIMNTNIYYQFSCAVENRDTLALHENVVWINLSDKHFSHCTSMESFYDENLRSYLFKNMTQMFKSLDYLYTSILSIPIENEASLNLIMAYQNRCNNIRNTIKIVENTVMMHKVDDMMSHMKI